MNTIIDLPYFYILLYNDHLLNFHSDSFILNTAIKEKIEKIEKDKNFNSVNFVGYVINDKGFNRKTIDLIYLSEYEIQVILSN